MRKYSDTKLTKFTDIKLNGDITLSIGNIKIGWAKANIEANCWIVDLTTGQKYEEIQLFKQVYGSDGNLLEEPIYDRAENYVIEDYNGEQMPCFSKEIYEN